MKLWCLIIGLILPLIPLHGSDPMFPVLESGSKTGLDNLIRLSPRILSGGEPLHPESFHLLKALEVKTIVSVDGASPNLEAAQAEGLRYIHIPIGYDGVPETARLALIRVLQEDTGRLYFHCHHGRHRGPAAAAIAGLVEGCLTPESAEAFLLQAGTSPDYAGLWRDVRKFHIPNPLPPLPELQEKAEIGTLAQSMALADRHWDQIKIFQKNQWNLLPNLPEIQPAREALLLAEIFKESARTLESNPEMASIQQEMLLMAETFQQLRNSLKLQKGIEANEAFLKLSNGCRSCHRAHRDSISP